MKNHSNHPKLYPSTVENSFIWRLWQGTNYMIGGTSYLLASFCYFLFMAITDSTQVASLLYTIGSFSQLLAGLTEWNKYRQGCILCEKKYKNFQDYGQWWKKNQLGLNSFASVIGSAFFFKGSICFLPANNQFLLGEAFFIIGTAFIIISQVWKCYRTAFTRKGTWVQNITQDRSGFFAEIFSGIGLFFYIIGTVFFHLSQTDASKYLVAANFLYVKGGLSFTISGIFVLKKYFCQKNKRNQNYNKVYQL